MQIHRAKIFRISLIINHAQVQGILFVQHEELEAFGVKHRFLRSFKVAFCNRFLYFYFCCHISATFLLLGVACLSASSRSTMLRRA